MATSVIRFTNLFSDESTGNIEVGPIDTTALDPDVIRANVKAWNGRLATDTSKASLLAGKNGGDWTSISEVRITTTTVTFVS